MYKMSTDESLLLRAVISNLETEIRDAKESGCHDEHWISQITFRLACLKRRLGWADIVQVEELGRPHYSQLLETGMTISQGEYHVLQTNISKYREMIQMMWVDSPEDPAKSSHARVARPDQRGSELRCCS